MLRRLTPEEHEGARPHGSMGNPLAGTVANKRSVTRTTSYNAHPVVDEISLLVLTPCQKSREISHGGRQMGKK